jgi:hypothetical protein
LQPYVWFPPLLDWQHLSPGGQSSGPSHAMVVLPEEQVDTEQVGVPLLGKQQ